MGIEVKLTPGPWKLEFSQKSGTANIYGVRADGDNRQSDGYGHLFSVDLAIREDADKPMFPAIDAQQEANARAISAVPEMVRALLAAEERLVALYRGINTHANYDDEVTFRGTVSGNRFADDDDAVQSIRAALSKALGETP